MPEYPIRSLAEAFYHLRKTLGINSTNAQMNMVHRYYRDHKFVLALQCEKLEVPVSPESIRVPVIC